MNPLYLIANLLEFYSYLILGVVLISWLPIEKDSPIVQFLEQVTEPALAPVRRLLNPQSTGGLDFSPIVVLVVLQMIADSLRRAG